MKTIIGAIAVAIAVPAFAQTAPAEPKKMECCEKMKAEGKECCCKGMAQKDHDMKQDRPRVTGNPVTTATANTPNDLTCIDRTGRCLRAAPRLVLRVHGE